MSSTVKEIMNRELFHVRPLDSSESVLDGLLGLEITSAPVLDQAGRPLGVVSLRDIVADRELRAAGELMSSPAVVIDRDAAIQDAARLIGETGHRRLVVVDDHGRAVGMVSAVDVVRALAGLPSRHPQPFPHLDLRTGLSWTDDRWLDGLHVEYAPEGPGILMLLHDVPGEPERIVWVESVDDVRSRLREIVSMPTGQSPGLARWLIRGEQLRFRAASISDPEAREALLGELRPQIAPHLNPRAVVS
jgi:hypothetical protein